MTFPFPLFRLSPLKVSFYFAIIFAFVFLYKYYSINGGYLWNTLQKGKYEGFTQDTPFVSKTDSDIYDAFYCDIYDDITDTKMRTEEDYNIIPSLANDSIVLVVGCGSGALVEKISTTITGVTVRGMDKSSAMIEKGESKNIDELYCADAEDPTQYPRSHFSHILCFYMTFYEIKNPLIFLRNVYYGLQPDGYFVVHLIDTAKTDDTLKKGIGLVDLGKPKSLDEKYIKRENIQQFKFRRLHL
jgi:SAM-dependent methyltransferase